MQAIWEQNRAEVLSQVTVIEQAVSQGRGARADDELRAIAAREAHKVSGSVGTLGFALAAEHARELERALSGPEAPRADELPRLAELVAALRQELESAELEAPAATAAPPVDSDAAPGGMTLLVVDREVARGREIVAEAERRGLAVSSAASLASAREAVAQGAPEVVLLDLGTSDALESSLGFLGEIARDRPVVVVTDPARSVDVVEVARRGGRGFLPYSLSGSQIVDAVTALLARLRTRGTRVLALDDDHTVLALLKEVLGAAQMSVLTCAEPSSFLGQLEETAPDLVIMDYDMPGVTGPELCRTVRNDRRWEGLPIVLLTSRTDSDSVRAVFDAGADDYVSKPFVGPELVARISNRLERVRLYRALAETDPLTGLANRRRAADAMSAYLRMAARMAQPLCLGVMDVDKFKGINDSHGHDVGDAVLRGLGIELQRWFRGEDVVARWGGDEFVLGMFAMSLDDGHRRMGDFVEAMRERTFGGVAVTVSAGLAAYPNDGDEFDALYRAADRALYKAKSEGRDGVALAGRGSLVENRVVAHGR